jgi:hypothetical protein
MMTIMSPSSIWEYVDFTMTRKIHVDVCVYQRVP